MPTGSHLAVHNRTRGENNRKAILDLLARGTVTHKSAARELNLDATTVRAHLLALVDSGAVRRERETRLGGPTGQPAWVYSLVPQPIAYEVLIEPTDLAIDFDSFWVVDLPVPLGNDRVLLQTPDGRFFVGSPVAVVG